MRNAMNLDRRGDEKGVFLFFVRFSFLDKF